MQFKISTDPEGLSFTADPEQSILEAGLAAGLLLPYGCRDGACGSCKAQVLSGEVDLGAAQLSALPDAERAAGFALLCQARARSDLVIRARSLGSATDIPIKKLPCRIQSLERVAPDVMVLTVKLPATEPFVFRAGQYINFLLPNGKRRSFSIANAPHESSHIELHVRLVEGGQFTGHVFSTMKPRDILRFEGPLGTFFLRDHPDRPALLVAGGTGFAPMKSIVENAIATGSTRPMTLYWGARRRDGLYMDELAHAWEQALPGFRYVPVLSEPAAEDAWSGRRGLVHEAVVRDFPDLSGHEVYACGAPAMIDAARTDFHTRCGLPGDAFFADAFTFAPDSSPRSS